MDSIKELHEKKNHDYASDNDPYSNFEYAASLLVGFTDPVDQVFVAIIGIKLARLGQLLGQGKEPNNESVEDTMRDLTTYCGIWTARRIDNSPFNLVKKDMKDETRELANLLMVKLTPEEFKGWDRKESK